MKKTLMCLPLLLCVAACVGNENAIRVSNAIPEKQPNPQPEARTEPIFYNGKTYTLKFVSAGQGRYDMSVLGMGPKQQADASNIATSAIRYFACPDGKKGKLTQKPQFDGTRWNMIAQCA